MNNVSDSRLASMLRKFLSRRYEDEKKMKGIQLCGSRMINHIQLGKTVFVMSDEAENSAFFGNAHCHSPWCCPICTPKVMAKKGTNIACLIDARIKWEGLVPFMVTFTMPHNSQMSCEFAFEVLQKAWRMFIRPGHRGKNSQGKSAGAWGKFREEFDVKHLVRVYEFNWGVMNGWHPHIHALFWTKPENLPLLAAYEDELADLFYHCAEYSHMSVLIKKLLTEGMSRAIIRDSLSAPRFKDGIGAWAFQRLLREIDLDALDEELPNELYPDSERMKVSVMSRLDRALELFEFHKYKPDSPKCVWFSKDKHGQVRSINSSYYLSGWGGDSELTNSTAKTSQYENHYTMPELLIAAYESESVEERDYYLRLFVEYAIATRGARRVCFTPGDNKLIEKWKQTEDFVETYKKKAMDRVREMHVVFWFTEQEWSRISYEELYSDYYIKDRILELARAPDCEEKIIAYLAEFNIFVAKKKVHHATDIVNRLFSHWYEEQLMNDEAEVEPA